MSTARKMNSEAFDANPSARALSDINNLQKRLAELLEQDIPGSRVSFGFAVLNCVAQGHYDRALAELESVGNGLEEYQLFEFRARRFIEHAKSLVITIKAKHTVGTASNVNKSKQKELSDKIAEHFLELKRTIITIEKIQKGVRSADLSATAIFLRSIFFAITAIFIAYGVQILWPEFSTLTIEDFMGFMEWMIPWLKMS